MIQIPAVSYLISDMNYHARRHRPHHLSQSASTKLEHQIAFCHRLVILYAVPWRRTRLIMHARTVLYTKHLLLTILPTSMAVPQSHLLASVQLSSTRPCSACRCLPEHQFTKLSRSMTSPNPSSGRSSGTSPCVGASTFGPGLDLDPFACDCDCDPELAAAVCSRADVPAVEPSGTDFEGEG
jgi:hypothetical protein